MPFIDASFGQSVIAALGLFVLLNWLASYFFSLIYLYKVKIIIFCLPKNIILHNWSRVGVLIWIINWVDKQQKKRHLYDLILLFEQQHVEPWTLLARFLLLKKKTDSSSKKAKFLPPIILSKHEKIGGINQKIFPVHIWLVKFSGKWILVDTFLQKGWIIFDILGEF